MLRDLVRGGVVVLLAVSCLGGAAPGQELDSVTKAKVEAQVRRVLQETGVPSAQVGIVRDGKVVYTEAFGAARLAVDGKPEIAAMPEMHYAVGSISKQFTAACVLLLQERGKLKLDDPVGRWFPELTEADKVTVRNLLTHTSGYSDYAPQDYTIPIWTKTVDPLALVREWAEKPLDFEPGTKWQYSNTNFVLAGLIVEKASGEPFMKFLRENVLEPLHLKEVLDLDTQRDRMEPVGYMRNALGPLRPALAEAPGWYFADGELAMPVRTLLEWDIHLMERSLLKPESYDALEMEMKLKDGSGSHYGLGVQVGQWNGRRMIFHTGEVGGFVAANVVLLDDKVAVAVLTNQEANSAASMIGKSVLGILAPAETHGNELSPEAQAKTILAGLQKGTIDRGLFTADANFYFTEQAIGDFASSLGPLGEVKTVDRQAERLRGGMTFRSFKVTFGGGKTVTLTTYTTTDGKLEQFLIEP